MTALYDKPLGSRVGHELHRAVVHLQLHGRLICNRVAAASHKRDGVDGKRTAHVHKVVQPLLGVVQGAYQGQINGNGARARVQLVHVVVCGAAGQRGHAERTVGRSEEGNGVRRENVGSRWSCGSC